MPYKPIYKKLGSLRKRSKKQGWEYDLDTAWLRERLEAGVCEATGEVLDLEGAPFNNPKAPSIDRKNESKGYTKDNCRVTTLIYNLAKGDQSEEVLIDWAKAFVEKYENEINLGKSV